MDERREAANVAVTATLPVCLHLDDRPFAFPDSSGTDVLISCSNVESETPTWIGKAQGMEARSDSFSHFRFTQLKVALSVHLGATENPALTMDAIRVPFLNAVNQFIDAARVALRRPGLKNYRGYEDFHGPINVLLAEEASGQKSGVVSLLFGGGLGPFLPQRTDSDHKAVQALLGEPIPLHVLFLADARRDHYYENPVPAAVHAVIALELALAACTRAIGASKGLEPDAMDSLLFDVGVSGNLKTLIPLLRPEAVTSPSEEVFQACKGAITVRNAIVHKGRRDLGGFDIGRALSAVETMHGFLDECVRSVEG